MQKQRISLLLTSCIKPPEINLNNHAIYRSDALVRLADYKTALTKWLSHADERIVSVVFVDNSGYDLSDLINICQLNNVFERTVEFLQLEATAIPPGAHYGFSELEMIDYAFEKSHLLQASDYIIKVTGRLYFPNISKLIDRTSNFEFIADSRDYDLFHIHKHYILTTLLIFKPEFYKTWIFDKKKLMGHGRFGMIEELLYNIVKPLYQSKAKLMLRLPFNVEPVGVGAHWNVDYQSKKKKIINTLRNVSRHIMPAFWI